MKEQEAVVLEYDKKLKEKNVKDKEKQLQLFDNKH